MATRSIITAASPMCRSAISSARVASGRARRSSNSTGCASRSSSRVVAHLLWPRGTDLALRSRLGGCRASQAGSARDHRRRRGRDGGHRRLRLLEHQGPQSLPDQRPRPRSWRADYERKYLKYEKLPQPAITHVDARRPALSEETPAAHRRAATTSSTRRTPPIRRRSTSARAPQALEWLKLDVAGAHLVMDDQEFGYRIYRFDKPLAPGATTALTFRSRAVAARLPGLLTRRPTSSKTARS